jgi:hypothetical protein
MWFCALLALILTIGLLVGGVFKKRAWAAIPALWAPWRSHWRVWKWSWRHFRDPDTYPSTNMEVLAAQEADQAPTARRRAPRPKPVIYPEDVLAAMFLALDGIYLVVLAGIIVVSTCSFSAVNGVPMVFHSDARATKPAAVQPTITHQASQQQKQEFDLQPLLTQAEANGLRTKKGVNNFVIVGDNGGVEFSANWTASPTDPAWAPAFDSAYITASTHTGASVTFMDQHQNEFTVNVNMPIYFPGNTAVIYMFNAQGELMQAPRDSLKKLKLSAVPSPIAANPNLTTL